MSVSKLACDTAFEASLTGHSRGRLLRNATTGLLSADIRGSKSAIFESRSGVGYCRGEEIRTLLQLNNCSARHPNKEEPSLMVRDSLLPCGSGC